jgi:4-hydroxythreonine-4-phosphate dehydrogenase
VELCAAGSVDAIATAPINKRALFLGGYSFPVTRVSRSSHGAEECAMAFVAANLRIVLLSTHVPLSQAIRMVEKDRLVRSLTSPIVSFSAGASNAATRDRGAESHGAEGGLFGVEEASEIMPAIEASRRLEEINVQGPFSADTVFLRASRGEFDAVIACYHDQAMIPVKCLSFGEAGERNVGSAFHTDLVDHGTAFDIAGKGLAEHSSMVAAIKLAAELSMKSGESCRAGRDLRTLSH